MLRGMCLWLLAAMVLAPVARAEDGYRLWLRYDALSAQRAGAVAQRAASITGPDRPSAVVASAISELQRGLGGMLAREIPAGTQISAGTVILANPSVQARLGIDLPLSDLGAEGYLLRSMTLDGKPVTVVAANGDAGLLYGAFALLEHIQRGLPIDEMNMRSAPKLQLRVLDHWDNLDGSVERGYAGQSIWNWWTLPEHVDPRLVDYARANASIGINGAVLNNVNASALSLTPRYIAKAAAIADTLRPWGMKVYLSARFSAPIELGGLDTADPLDPEVAAWWKAKADEIYASIPDFGGFLVKANSEGQPGPQDYHRSHAEGANMLAAAVAPHGGIVMWRAFVYSAEDATDRAKQAYAEFKPLDGTFADNVLLQVKNGPIDFQPREPFHPLFGAMPETPLMMEFQITKEYLGQATHLVYLGPLWEEVLEADTRRHGEGATVAKVIEGRYGAHKLTGMAGVANIGDDRDWTGSTFNQANWFAFGRMAWNPQSSARNIAVEWAELTFGPRDDVTRTVLDMMMTSREAVVNYMTPLGLAHQMATGHHYGPGPWVSDLGRPEWNPAYYNRADKDGIGFDRTASGSNAIAQYAPPVAKEFGDLAAVPDRDLLWFHHLAWDYRMRSGETLWQSLLDHYQTGVEQVQAMERQWQSLKGDIDPRRFAKTADFLRIQEKEAKWWRDASVLYWESVSGKRAPEGYPEPAHDLDYYKALRFPNAPGH
ncbi:alpha-glucuronidase family glycosyl hydrolase [Stakelama saccharophila]